jgi:hypothetical protein
MIVTKQFSEEVFSIITKKVFEKFLIIVMKPVQEQLCQNQDEQEVHEAQRV